MRPVIKSESFPDANFELLLSGRNVETGHIEEFAARVYRKFYGASLSTFCRELLALSSEPLGIVCCIGVNMPETGPLFLEQYIDRPIEEEIAGIMRRPVRRDEVVEVGTLAVRSRGLCRLMMAALAGFVLGRRKRYLAFTAVKSLRNTLGSLGVPFRTITRAVPERFKTGGEWGTYYDASPEVIVVDMKECLLRIRRLLETTGGKNGAVEAFMREMCRKGMRLEDGGKRAAGF